MNKRMALFLTMFCCLLVFSAVACENGWGDDKVLSVGDKDTKSVANRQRPERPYPDWMCLTERCFHEEIYRGDDDWHFHYHMDWENFLIYGMILHNKDYKIEGGTPGWFADYVKNLEVTPFDYAARDITLMFYKKGWIRNRLTFHLEDRVSETGLVYNVSAKIEPDPEFLEGKPAPGRAAVPREVWMRYVAGHMDRLKSESDWNPTKKPEKPELSDRRKELEATIQLYFDASYELDKQKARDAFHPVAHLYLVGESGVMNALTVDDFVKIFDAIPSPQSVGQQRDDEKILSIDFTGENTAVARVRLRVDETLFTDILGFVYTDGHWRIVSKIASGVKQPEQKPIAVHDLYGEFLKDKEAASKTYQGKRITVAGTVVAAGPDPHQKPAIELARSKDEKSLVLCVVDSFDQLEGIAVGDEITATGNFHIFGHGWVVLKQSEIR